MDRIATVISLNREGAYNSGGARYSQVTPAVSAPGSG